MNLVTLLVFAPTFQSFLISNGRNESEGYRRRNRDYNDYPEKKYRDNGDDDRRDRHSKDKKSALASDSEDEYKKKKSRNRKGSDSSPERKVKDKKAVYSPEKSKDSF